MDKVYSHPGKELKDHSFNVYQLGMEKFKQKNLNFTEMDQIKLLIRIVLLTHDFGKANHFFQKKLELASQGKQNSLAYQELTVQGNNKSNHSLLSALFTYYLLNELLEEKKFSLLGLIIVYRHHSNLKNFKDMLRIKDWKLLEEQFSTINLDYLQVVLNSAKIKCNIKSLSFEDLKKNFDSYQFRRQRRKLSKKLAKENNYLMVNLVFSLLISADKAEAIFYNKDLTYQQLKKIVLNRRQLDSNGVDKYKKLKGWNKAESEINLQRNNIYDEIVKKTKELNLNQDRILSINVPTGTGKTLASLATGLKLRKRLKGNYRLIYTLPFTSIIDQNYNVFKDVFEKTEQIVDSSLMIKHHYLTPKTYTKKGDYDDEEYDISKHLIESWNSEIVVTTFVQLLHSIFSNQNRSLIKFHNLANSIILLDEVQNIPHKYWKLIKIMFKELAEKLDCYFIFITATMPLIYNEEAGEIKELAVNKEDYFQFFDRIKLNLSEFRDEKTIAEFKEFIEDELTAYQNKNFLIVLNTIKTSIEVYNYIQELIAQGIIDGETVYLSTNIIPKEREERINKIGDGCQRQIIVSTQMVEAGVDIDLDRVYRDFAPLDSINQTCGRCNRNFDPENKGEVTLVKLINEKHNDKSYASYIYSDILLNSTQEILSDFPDMINEKYFLKLNNRYFRQLNKVKSNDISSQLLDKIKKLKYEKAFWRDDSKNGEIFRLIEQDFATVNLFIEIDKRAERIWGKYQEINKIEIKDVEAYSQRKAEFESIKQDFLNYVITIPEYVAKEHLENIEIKKTFNRIDIWQWKSVYDLETGFKRENDKVNSFF